MKIVLLLFCSLIALPQKIHATFGSGGESNDLVWQCPYCRMKKPTADTCRKHIRKAHVCDTCHKEKPSLDTNGFATQIFANEEAKDTHMRKMHCGIGVISKQGAAVLGAEHPIYLGHIDETKCFPCAFCRFPIEIEKIKTAWPAHMRTSAHCNAFYGAKTKKDEGDAPPAGAGGGEGGCSAGAGFSSHSYTEAATAKVNGFYNTTPLCIPCIVAMIREGVFLPPPGSTSQLKTYRRILPPGEFDECACEGDCESRKK